MSITNENRELGERITRIRTSQKLTLRQLADKIALSPSLLSQIEKGRINPSLSTLRAIASALNTPLFSFFLEEVTTDDLVVRAGTGRKILFPDVSLEYSLLTPDLSGTIEMALMKLPPHSLSSQDLFSHSGEEVAYVADGELQLYLGDKTVLLQNGDSVKIPPGTPHKWENKTGTEAILIFAVTPPTF
ncbi:MAG: cupin domain-containing protein [Sporomusaceae bacterium]|nr:cupin domain-containing protein [Sporomusaceae bacterium]